ncbi:serine hydrolase [Amycolatopsis endophytica]|uniref:Dipeptidyl aminopeptidase/acylaminoacyl peptidase n=1 Tax=Amycolatopsis endophytica TaxID=860233 RepID=A0A853BEV6_9PSEU|nr:serine hydrolase [Amycolatopsis endophytica]NYI93117.1 dipeptidyl aminopeptidase/acylaminoacyl peptidase [Amycolatopsis endophytica]
MTRRQRIADLTALTIPEQPALSPSGDAVVYVLRAIDSAADDYVYTLWRADSQGARQLTHGRCDTAPAFSPDGSRIAFLREQDVWLLPSDGGEAECLTSLPLGAGKPVWSPDGTKIAFAATVDLAPEDDHAPIVADRLDYHADGAGVVRGKRSHLHVVEVATGEVRRVTTGDWHAGQPAWSPDGAKLAFAAATGADRDLAIRVPVHVLDVTDPNSQPRVAGLADGIAAAVTWTADGAALLVVGHPASPEEHAGLFRIPLDGGETVNLAAPLDRNVMPGGPAYPGAWPRLVGEDVLFCVRDRGCTHLYSVPVGGGTPRPVLAGAGRTVAGLAVAGSTAAVVLTTPESYGEIVRLDLVSGTETVLTGHSTDEIELFTPREREFTISDGTVVHGWLLRDPAATGPGPLLLDVHGGPHNAWQGGTDEIHFYHQELIARGWTVLLLNPRGSDGYGEKFYTAVRGGWGVADARDFLEPLDELVAEGLADPARLAVTGYSYGGFMTCYLTSRDNRFAAAVAGGVVTDLTSMAGTSDEGHLLAAHELGALPWDEPESYAAMSPLAKVDQVRTPTLVLHGGSDLLCPVGQAQQWHTALRERGVPTRLVLYPEGPHAFVVNGRPSHRLDYNRRVVDWVERYTPGRRAPLDAAHWQRRLTELAERHHVPGACLGILRLDEEIVEARHGVLNVDTGVETTTDSLFQIGSISKVWTATVAMQLVDEGLLDLDAPVIDVLPELRLADPDVTKQLTMRHLLTHTSGIDGDVFTDTGRGDDCLEKYVARLDEVAQNHPLGATWSYCNSGFSLAGRVIEKLTGGTWDAALRERLFTPLGLAHTVTLPEEALMFRAAMGHVGSPEPAKAPVWTLPRSAGPAGLITATAADVLAFARMHLTGGLAADGTRVLSETSAAAMADKQVDLPDKHTLADSWGLGWFRLDWDGHVVLGHDGNTIGQAAFLRLLPEEGLAVTLLTNGGNTRGLYEDLYREIFAELAGVAVPRPLAPPASPVSVDVTPYLGTYERASTRMEVFTSDDGPRLRSTVTGPLAELVPDPVEEYDLVGVGDGLFVVWVPQVADWVPVTFYTLPTGEQYVHHGVRATPKVV